MSKLFKTCIFFSLLVLLTSTFYQIFLLSQNLYILKKGEKEINYLSKEVKKLEIELSEKSSLSKLEQFLNNSQLVKGKGKFIEVFESGMAAK